MHTPFRTATVTIAALALTACAGTSIDQNYAEVRHIAHDRAGVELTWLTSDEARAQARADVRAALSRPLAREDAVRLALAWSPALQAALYDGAAASAQATQRARLPNPVFTFERLMRGDGDARELDINRMLTLPIADLLLLPVKARAASLRQQQLRLQLAGEVVRAAGEADAAWIRAVAAQQSLAYATQVASAAGASAELARRMEAAGNFSMLQRAREQAFTAEAVAQLTRARQAAVASREALVRALGLDDAQAATLQLPDRLPDLPAAPRDDAATAQAALQQRLDVSLATANLDAEARRAGLTRVTSVVDGLRLGVERNGQTALPPQRGFQLELPLPLFDFGDAQRADAQASYMAALYRTAATGVRASSQLREAFANARAAHALALQYRDEIVPLRRAISDENLLRYNGMLIGVFDLLADAREQIGAVIASIDAQRDFWLADAALQAARIGPPAVAPGADLAPPF
jgi:outer membrane protein TolC